MVRGLHDVFSFLEFLICRDEMREEGENKWELRKHISKESNALPCHSRFFYFMKTFDPSWLFFLLLGGGRERANDYRVSQHVLYKLNVIFWSSEVCKRRLQILRKNVFCSKKLLFEPVLVNCKNEKGFFEQLSSIILCGNLFSKWRKAALESRFHFCSLGKKAEKAIFWSRIHFFGFS